MAIWKRLTEQPFGLGYKDGIIRLQYSFKKGSYEKTFTRIPRESDGEEAQEESDDTYLDVVDTSSVDTILR